MTLEVGQKVRYQRKVVEVVAGPDPAHKVVIKDKDGNLGVVRTDRLKPLEENSVKVWWVKDNLYIAVATMLTDDTERMSQVVVPLSQTHKIVSAIQEYQPEHPPDSFAAELQRQDKLFKESQKCPSEPT